jgi:hypothetical protein
MGWTVKNLTDGTSPTYSGGVADLVFQAAGASANGGNNGGVRTLLIQSDVTLPLSYTVGMDTVEVTPVVTVVVAGDCQPQGNAQVIQDNNLPHVNFIAAALVTISVPQIPGTYYLGGTLNHNRGSEDFALRIRVVPSDGLPLFDVVSWLPAGIVDFQFDLDTLEINSAVLSRMFGLPQGANFSLGIIPSLGGVALSSGVNAVSLRLSNAYISDFPPLVFTETGSPLAPVNIGSGENYWSLEGALTAPVITAWLQAANDAAAKANPPTDGPARVVLLAQIGVTVGSYAYLSKQVPFPLLQEV